MMDPNEPRNEDERDLDQGVKSLSASPLGQIPIDVTVAIGHAHPPVGELAGLSENAILPLDRNINDPVDLLVGGKLIARGVLVEIDDDEPGQLGIRLTNVDELSKARHE